MHLIVPPWDGSIYIDHGKPSQLPARARTPCRAYRSGKLKFSRAMTFHCEYEEAFKHLVVHIKSLKWSISAFSYSPERVELANVNKNPKDQMPPGRCHFV